MRKMAASRSFITTALMVLFLGAIDSINAQCEIEYFISFYDKDCTLLKDFPDHTWINRADG